MSSSTTKNPQRPPSVFERGNSYCTVVPTFFVSLLCYECFLLEMDGIRLGNACQLGGLTLPFRANAFILCLCGFDLYCHYYESFQRLRKTLSVIGPTSSSLVPMLSCAKLCTVCNKVRRRSSVSQLQGGSR